MNLGLGRLFTSLINQDYLENGYGFKTEIAAITVKSLVPSRVDLGVKLDYERFLEELKLWKYYRKNFNKALYRVEEVYEEVYFKTDSSIFSRLIPLIIVNKDMEIMEEEVIKNILFSSGNLEVLFSNLLISHLLKLYIDSRVDYINRLKEVIINFSQEEFLLKYGKYYRLDIKDKKKYKINFELEKIKLINYFNGSDLIGYEAFQEIFKLISNKDLEVETFEGKVVRDYLRDKDQEINTYYRNLGIYLENLRSSRIDPDKLEIKEYILPDIFSYQPGEEFYHSLLGQAVVEKKENNKGQVKSLIKTKTGYYIFNK